MAGVSDAGGAIEPLWSRLAQVTRVRTASDYHRGGESGVIEATVGVRVEEGGDRVVFHERGEAATPDGRRFTTRNAVEWRALRETQGIEVAHLRHGEDHPTPLVRLRASGDGTYESVEPHVCGEDRYACRARPLAGGGVEVVWTVTGPSTQGEVRTRYI